MPCLIIPLPLTGNSFVTHVHHICYLLCELVDIQQRQAEVNLKVMMGVKPNEILDVCVTCDCTWSKRGFTAMYGVVAVISWASGEVLDCDILSKHCSECVRWDGADLSSDEYIQWYNGHKDQCTQNFAGSSPAKEAEGVLRIWQRSET